MMNTLHRVTPPAAPRIRWVDRQTTSGSMTTDGFVGDLQVPVFSYTWVGSSPDLPTRKWQLRSTLPGYTDRGDVWRFETTQDAQKMAERVFAIFVGSIGASPS